MSNRHSFYIKNSGVSYSFDTIAEMKEFCDPNGIDIESVEIFLGDHCDSLTDDEYCGFYEIAQKSGITDYHLNLFEKGELFNVKEPI